MPTSTSNYGWTKPDVGGSSGAWGGNLNTDLDSIDSTVFTVSGVANAALPKAGGTMTGQINSKTEAFAITAKGSISGAQSLDMSAAQYFTMTITGSTTLSITGLGGYVANTAFPIILRITNGGANVTWPASFKHTGGTAPSLSTAGTDMLCYVSDDQGTTFRQLAFSKGVA